MQRIRSDRPSGVASFRNKTLMAAIMLSGIVLVSGHTLASIVPLTKSSATSEDWTTAANWSDHLAVSASNDYTVGSGLSLRTPLGADSTFGGKSLAVSGVLSLQSSSSVAGPPVVVTPHTATINSFSITGGSTVSSTAGAISVASGGTLNGTTLALSGTIYVDTSVSNTRRAASFQFTNFSGSGSVLLDGRGTLTLNNTNTTYTGQWSVGGANSNNNGGLQPAELIGLTAGSLGTGNITVNNNGQLDVGYDYNVNSTLTLVPTSSAAAVGTILLNHNLSFGAVNIGGTLLAKGTYTYAALNSAYDAYFVNGGSGSITVLPEPAGMGLLVVGIGSKMIRRRRAKTAQ